MPEPMMADPEAERAVVGAVLIRPEVFAEAGLTADNFRDVDLALVWRVLQDMAETDQAIDLLTIQPPIDARMNGREAPAMGWPALLTSCIDACPSPANIAAYAERVKEAARRRLMYVIGHDLAVAATDAAHSTSAALSIASRRLDTAGRELYQDERDQWSPAELVALDLPATPWLLDQILLDGGVNLLAGPGGSYKTFLGLDVALAVFSGGKAWGRQALQGNVLYCGPDSPRSTFQRRFRWLCRGRGIEPPHNGFTLDLSPLDLGSDADALTLRRMAENIDARLIILDSLYSFLGGRDENAAAEMALVMGNVREVAQRTGATVLVQHHSTKNEIGSPASRIRGSSALVAAVDEARFVEVKGAGAARTAVLSFAKSREGSDPNPSTFAIQETGGGGLVLAFGAAEEGVVADTLAETAVALMLDVLHGQPSDFLGHRELEAELGRRGLRAGRRTLESAFGILAHAKGVQVAKNGRVKSYAWSEA